MQGVQGDPAIHAVALGQLTALDASILVLYLVALAAVTVYVNRSVGGADAEHYFLGGRDLPFWAVGFSLFASNLGTDHLVGLAGSGAAGGLAVGYYEWSACYVLMLLGWLFVPHYLAYDIYTVPEYLERRFGKNFRTFFTWLSIAATLFTKISVTIFAGAVVMRDVLGWNMWVSSVVLLALTCAYTSIGGLAAVVYTEVLQSLILIVGSCALLWYGMGAVGGWEGLRRELPHSHFQLLLPSDHPDFPWLGSLLGMPIAGIWYWCTDQVMVQRVLASKSVATGQQACVMAGWLKILPMYIMVLPGLVAAALYPKEIEEDSNRAFALLVTRLLPPGWQGPMIAVMLSSFMAALASCFNSCSTLFTMDVYSLWRPDHTEAELVYIGRLFTVVLAALSLAWLPVIAQANDQLFLYIQGMQIIWCSPIAVVFLASCASETLSARTAMWTLVCGLAAGAAFWAWRNAVPQAWRHSAVDGLNILHYSLLLFAFSASVMGVLHATEQRGAQSMAERTALVGDKVDYRARIAQQEWAGTGTKVSAAVLAVTVAGLTLWFH